MSECPVCKSPTIVNWQPPTCSVTCTNFNCTWGVATTRFPPIFEDPIIYKIHISPGNLIKTELVELIKLHINIGTKKAIELLKGNESIFLFEGNAYSIIKKVTELKKNQIIFKSTPEFPWVTSDLMGTTG